MKNNSARKKLIPAAAMLAVSAAMLATSTYAWFTMSKEVEVTGIEMTATVPATLQISLGDGQQVSPGGNLTYNSSGTNATKVAAPNGDSDWSNTVAVSDYYEFGRLKPASSTTGATIFYTENANGVGQTVENTAQFVAVGANHADMTGFAFKNVTSAIEGQDSTKEGYYIDIPVWFRSSMTGTTNLGVKATIIAGGDDDTIFDAARVSILEADSATNTANQGVYKNTAAAYYDRYNTTNSNFTAAVTNQAVKAAGTLSVSEEKVQVSAVYGAATLLTQSTGANDTSATQVVAVPGPTGTDKFGTPVQMTIRVWLEGEDTDCWNATVGQSFKISLNFYDTASAT